MQAKQPKEGSVLRYIARKIDKRWVVAFGRLNEKQEKFLIAYEATQGDKPDVFNVKEMTPPKEDTGFYLSAAKAIDTSLKDFMDHFEGEQRPYNVAVLPAKKGQVWVYLVPAPTKPKVWPLGADVRYLISANDTKIVEKGQLHKSVIEVEPPKQEGNEPVAGSIHTHVLSETPEDTDVFHVLTRKPSALSQLNCRVNRLQFRSCVVDLHLPVDAALCGVDVGGPSVGFLTESRDIGESAVRHALACE